MSVGTETRPACHHSGLATAAPIVNTVRFDLVDPSTGLESGTTRFVRCGRAHVVHFLAVHPTTLARRDAAYCRLLNDGDLNLPDGAPIVLALRMRGHRTRRATGTDSMQRLCAWSVDEGLRHFLYGGTPELLAELRRRLERSHPGIAIVGSLAPPFRSITTAELADHADLIRQSQAELVWIGLGTPKQDAVAAELRRHECAAVFLCVGAAFDFLAGRKSRAPRTLQRLGLEWAYRLWKEPRRLWRRYLIGNPQFVAGVVADHLRSAVRPIRGSAG
jgi:N-acetylglucosaminyldiphosphoundecaprenol N-acetyl-beta-D-mannosaminyltransferase